MLCNFACAPCVCQQGRRAAQRVLGHKQVIMWSPSNFTVVRGWISFAATIEAAKELLTTSQLMGVSRHCANVLIKVLGIRSSRMSRESYIFQFASRMQPRSHTSTCTRTSPMSVKRARPFPRMKSQIKTRLQACQPYSGRPPARSQLGRCWCQMCASRRGPCRCSSCHTMPCQITAAVNSMGKCVIYWACVRPCWCKITACSLMC
jgi:hypothetical protein